MSRAGYGMDLDLTQEEKRFNPLVTPYEVPEDEFPWEGPIEEQFAFLVWYAILAPSSRNAQPWKFGIFPSGIAVYPDYERRLPVSDPNDRELIMSLGAAVFILRVAAAHFGFKANVIYSTGDGHDTFAFVHLRPRSSEEGSPTLNLLFGAITQRHTNRAPFLAARVPRYVVDGIRAFSEQDLALAYVSTDSDVNADIAGVVHLAEERMFADPDFRREMAEWMRLNETQRTDGIPGGAFGLGNVTSASAPWILRAVNKGWFTSIDNLHLCLEAPALVVIHSEDSIESWFDAGQLLGRILLYTVHNGMQSSFFNVPVEVHDFRVVLKHRLALSHWPQLLLRLGYCLSEPARTPRRPVEEVLLPLNETDPRIV